MKNLVILALISISFTAQADTDCVKVAKYLKILARANIDHMLYSQRENTIDAITSELTTEEKDTLLKIDNSVTNEAIRRFSHKAVEDMCLEVKE